MVGTRYDRVADVIDYCQTRTDAYLVRDALNALNATTVTPLQAEASA
jgi:hypothetical protein